MPQEDFELAERSAHQKLKDLKAQLSKSMIATFSMHA
jgi:hypothetical protein